MSEEEKISYLSSDEGKNALRAAYGPEENECKAKYEYGCMTAVEVSADIRK